MGPNPVDRSTDAARTTGVGGSVGTGANGRGIGFMYWDGPRNLSQGLADALRWLWSRMTHKPR